MKIVIPGGTGQVGTLLARKFRADGHEVAVFGRSQRDWPGAIDGSDVVINLAGRSVNCGTRKVKLRSAMTMSPDPGGIFCTLLTLVRSGLGGKVGDGRQYVSWIHEIDFIRAVYWLIEREHLEGAVNLAASEPLPHKEFMAASGFGGDDQWWESCPYFLRASSTGSLRTRS